MRFTNYFLLLTGFFTGAALLLSFVLSRTELLTEAGLLLLFFLLPILYFTLFFFLILALRIKVATSTVSVGDLVKAFPISTSLFKPFELNK